MKGIDVSHHNGTINWDKVKAAGIEFAILRATHGTESVDEQFERNYAEAKRVGIKVGVYHYLYYVDPIKHQKEVANFLNHIRGKVFELGAYMDYEEENPKFNPIGALSKQAMTDYAISDFDKIRAEGFKPGIYASAYWMIHKIDMGRIPADVTIWCADWSGAIDYKGRVDIHQNSATGTVPGIGSGVDMDITLTEFIQPVVPEVSEPPAASTGINIDGDRGPETIKLWQKVMRTKADGRISTPVSTLIKADQRFLNKVVPTALIKKYTSRNYLKIDGDEGVKTIKIRQSYMFNAHKDVFRQVAGREVRDADITGKLDELTIKVHQTLLNRAVIGSGAY